MAATLLREAYDCIVLGSGRTASQIAAAVARTGQHTLQLMRESAVGQSWLQPRWDCYSKFAAGQRLPLSGVSVINATGKRISSIRAAAGLAPQQSVSRHVAAATFTLPFGCRVACDAPREVCLNGALPPQTIRANVVIEVRNRPNAVNESAIGGIYRDVSAGDNEKRQALIFATQRAGEVFWLVPMSGALWSIGLRSRAEHSLAKEAIADAFEDALVACPALTQRLIAAQLVGGLHCSTATTQPDMQENKADVLSLPDYNYWLDPVFASSDWLGDELATQFAPLLTAEDASFEKFAAFQQQWLAVEQLTRERIAPWYQQHEALTDALHDHAQREWYERLLTGGPAQKLTACTRP